MQFPTMPSFEPINLKHLYPDSVNYDKMAYAESDWDFARRHPSTLKAERLFEGQNLKDQQGNSELMPALQNEFMRSGLSNSLGAFGDTPGNLAPGSAGEASVARNLGNSIMGFQQMNRQNRQNSLLTAEQLFPRRTFGLTGSDVANVDIANTMGQNNWNQTNFANQVMMDQYQQQLGAQKKAQSGAQTGSMVQGGASIIGAIAMAAAMSCWVARQVFTPEDNSWRVFRNWMLRDSPKPFKNLYLKHGEKIAQWLKVQPRFASRMIKLVMSLVVTSKRNRWKQIHA